MIEHTYVINLDHRKDRWNNIQKDFKDIGLHLQRWNAIYGKNLSDDEISKLTTWKCNQFCTYGMIGCWLSHYTLWQYIVKNNLDNVLILEDDATPNTKTYKDIDRILAKLPENYDLVYLGYVDTCDYLPMIFQDSVSNKIYNMNKTLNGEYLIPCDPLCLHAYLLSNAGARKLINYTELQKINDPIDTALSQLFKQKRNDFNVYKVKTPLIDQVHIVENSDLVKTQYPILTSILLKIKISDSFDLGYYLQCPILTNRKTNIEINGLLISFAVLAFFMGLFVSDKFLIYIVIGIIGLFFVESISAKEKNYLSYIFNLIIIILFMFIGKFIAKNNLK